MALTRTPAPDVPALRGALVGVVHLGPLPGSPGFRGGDVIAPAVRDARRYADAGFDALVVENFGDAPFWKDAVPPETIAALAVAARAIREAVPALPLGVNVLRNDARAALGIAAAVGAAFIRVNVHIGAAVTDQGLVEGRAAETLRARSLLGPGIAILADVLVKHAAPLAPAPIEIALEETLLRGMADGAIVTGATTGRAPDISRLTEARAVVDRIASHAAQGAPGPLLLLGSGLSAENAATLAPLVDAAIVGTSVKKDGVTTNEVDPARARALVKAWREARQESLAR